MNKEIIVAGWPTGFLYAGSAFAREVKDVVAEIAGPLAR